MIRRRLNLEGRICRLRALEPADIDLLYAWENDPSVWGVSGTLAPFSRHALEALIESQRYDLFQNRQLRLIVETAEGRPLGAVDLFEIDPLHRRAGVGILIHRTEDRNAGYATDALRILIGYARTTLRLHQLWCGIETDNAASLALFRGVGFEQTGLKRDWNRTPEGWKDEATFQLILEKSEE